MMEYKKKSRESPPSGTTSHYSESNAGHITVKTTSPFLNKRKESEYKVTEQNQCKSTKNLSASVISKKYPKDVSSGTSKLLINQILGDNLDHEMILNLNKSYTEKNRNTENQSNYNQNFLINKVEYKYSTPTFNSKSFSMQPGSCSRDDSIVPSQTDENNRNESCSEINDATFSKNAFNEKKFAEKTTYCRPSLSHNHEFRNKTMERNNRLQRLVKKLILIRKKEKETEAWNNYINELKSKHGHYDMELNRIMGRHTLEEPTPLEYIDDYYVNQSDPCKDLLQDFYYAYDRMQVNTRSFEIDPHNHQNSNMPSCQSHRSYFNRLNCYPMSSQGRLMMLNREKRKNSLISDYSARRLPYGKMIIVDKEPTRVNPSSRKNVGEKTKPSSMLKSVGVQNASSSKNIEENINSYSEFKSVGVQTEINDEQASTSAERKGVIIGETNIEIAKETIKDAYAKVSENVERLKKKLCENYYNGEGGGVLESIENKLDSLINSINSFIDEVKSRTYVRQFYDCHSVSVDHHKPCSHKMNVTRSDNFELNKTEKLVCGIISENSRTTSTLDIELKEKSRAKTINRILVEEINSSNQAKADIENILSGSVGCPCSVQISIDIPTRDRATEVTASLEKAAPMLNDNTSVSIEEIDRSVGEGDTPQVTIAVNTDPLGLLALLRVSKETAMQLLSYVPNIPYHSYLLSMLHAPQTCEVPHYVCNICGAAFRRPSQLSDHIQGHDLTRTRDCCVCRHMLDMQRHRPPGLFRCQYCGQRFARAYCCELHQESCARRRGTRHDVSPSLMLLR